MKRIPTVVLALITMMFIVSFAVPAFASSALIKTVTSPQATMLAGDKDGLFLIIAQPIGMTTVRNVEKLNTLYFIIDQYTEGSPGILFFEVDKTYNSLNLQNYKLLKKYYGGTMPYYPSAIPDMDLHKAYRLIKEELGNEWVIASIGIMKPLNPPNPWTVVFNVKEDWSDSEHCEQWLYIPEVSDQEVIRGGVAHCWFDMNAIGTQELGAYGFLEP